ncbi:MAG: DUF86 domain-containing protein [Candidatus Sumerlaeia bacterium]
MSSERLWRFRIRHILEAIERIQAYAANLDLPTFQSDTRTMQAIAWNFMIIGEAARHIPLEIERSNPEVPWRDMRDMRNMIVHGYDSISPEIMFDTIRNDIPQLVPMLHAILARENEG